MALRDSSVHLVLAALGMQSGLSGWDRDAYRSYYTTTLLAISALIESEIRVKLDMPGFTITFPRIVEGDIAVRTRSVNSLVQAGVPLNDALKMVGLPTVTLPTVMGRGGRIA